MKFTASLLPKQYQFINSEKATNLYCGGIGAGKTVSEIVLALKYALEYPGIQILFCAPTYRMLKDVVIKEAENFIPKQLIADFPKSNYPEIAFVKRHGQRSKILFRAFDDFGKAKGITAGLAILDELTEFKKQVFDEVSGRLRQSGMPNRLFAATNPSDFENFVYKNIVSPYENKLEGSEDIAYIHTSSFDNFTLPENYLKRLRLLANTDLPRYNQSVLGMWGNFGQDIIGAFPFVKDFSTPYRVAFIDPSFSDNKLSDRTAVSIVAVNPSYLKESHEWEISFTGKKWEKSISNEEVQKELLIFLDKYKPVDTCLESQLGDSTSLFINALKQKEKELGLQIKNNWTHFHQTKNKHERIMMEVASNKYRIFALEETESNYLTPIVNYSKKVEHDDEIDSLAGGISLWYRSKVLQNYIRYTIEANRE